MEELVLRDELNFLRQMDIINPANIDGIPVTVIGAGGIGSPTIIALTKMGFANLTVFDDDKVEAHNLPNQIYRFSDIGKPKAAALAEICKDFTGVEINPVIERVTPDTKKFKGIVVSGVDSMDSRKNIWKNIRYNPAIPIYIEARMGAEVCRIYSINPLDPRSVAFYERTLYDDKDAAPEKCTEKAIIYNVFMISSLIASQAKKFIKKEEFPKEIIFDLKTLFMLINK